MILFFLGGGFDEYNQYIIKCNKRLLFGGIEEFRTIVKLETNFTITNKCTKSKVNVYIVYNVYKT